MGTLRHGPILDYAICGRKFLSFLGGFDSSSGLAVLCANYGGLSNCL